MKYGKWLDLWLENHVKPTCKPRTYEMYALIVKRRLKKALGGYELNELTPADIQPFISELMQSGNLVTGKGLSSATVNLIITVVQISLKAAFEQGNISECIASKIKRPKLKQKGVMCFNLTEQAKLESAVLSDKRVKMFGVALCLYTGLRIGELLALRWDDVDLKKGLIFVNKTCRDGKNEKGFLQIVGEPKTETSRRIIPLPKQLAGTLKDIKKSQKSKYVVSAAGKPIGIRSYQRSFALLLKKLKIEHKGFHSLRHTFATRALECGMDVKTLAEILGHKNATVTLNRYVHSLLEHKTEMMNKLGKLFLQRKSKA